MSDAAFQTVAQVGEIPEGGGTYFEIGDKVIAVFHSGGQYYAIDDCCPHQGAPLSDGVVDENECSVTCSWHGWRFSLEDGRHLQGSKARVRTYPVRVVDGEVQVAVE